MPTMYSFWSSILLGEESYTGRPFPKHLPLPIKQKHFDRWLELFHQTINDNFEGKLAIKQKIELQILLRYSQSKSDQHTERKYL
jgi:hemoglobin